MCRARAERPTGAAGPTRAAIAVAVVLGLFVAAAPAGATVVSPAGFEMTRSVQQSLKRLQELWLQWLGASLQDNPAKSGETLRWQELDLTFHFYPGQTYYHGALLVRKEGERPIFFIGDSFAPSGMDDYCVQNRNLLHEDTGYLLCLRKLGQLGGDFWLINEHIQHVFTFSAEERKYLESRYRERIRILRELLPWDDPNYGVDEQWAVFYPYGATLGRGKSLELEARVTNHSPERREFTITPRVHGGVALAGEGGTVSVEPRQSGAVKIGIRALDAPGSYIVTADIASRGIDCREWIEALITVE